MAPKDHNFYTSHHLSWRLILPQDEEIFKCSASCCRLQKNEKLMFSWVSGKCKWFESVVQV
jgi:hypothetical protein